MIPRIRGKVGQATEPPEYVGKWFFTVWMTELGVPFKEDEPMFGPMGPYDTEEIAHENLTEAVKLCCEKFERMENGQFSGEYIDMKDNTRKRFT